MDNEHVFEDAKIFLIETIPIHVIYELRLVGVSAGRMIIMMNLLFTFILF